MNHKSSASFYEPKAKYEFLSLELMVSDLNQNFANCQKHTEKRLLIFIFFLKENRHSIIWVLVPNLDMISAVTKPTTIYMLSPSFLTLTHNLNMYDS